MWDLVGNPEDRFSHNEAHISSSSSSKELFHEKTCFLHLRKQTCRLAALELCSCSVLFDSTIPLLSKSEIPSLLHRLLWLHSLVCQTWSCRNCKDRLSCDEAHLPSTSSNIHLRIKCKNLINQSTNQSINKSLI